MRHLLIFFSFFALAGCFDLEGYHKLERYGNSDAGAYRISMDTDIWTLMNGSDDYNQMMSQLRQFSNPTVTHGGGRSHIQDLSGRASMEYFYDNYTCIPDGNSRIYTICTFTMSESALDLTDWTIDWTVAIDPDMEVLSSNHHRTRRANGLTQLIWYFDGNQTSSYNVQYRIRVRNAS